MQPEVMTPLETDVLVIGAGGAGMYAALEAARSGVNVILADRSLIGRGGATVMAQMTVAAADNVSEGCGCSGNGEITPRLPIGGGGGGIGGVGCLANYISCTSKCDKLYPTNPANHAICQAICADIESECVGLGRGGGGVSRHPGVAFRRR